MLQESCVKYEVTIFNLDGGSSYVVELKDIVMHISLSRNLDPLWRLYNHLIVSPLFLYPLPSLISNCLNPPFGTQGRSRRLNEAYILQTRNGEHRTDLYSRAPQSSTQFGTPLQYSCLENPMDGGAWWAAVHGVARVGHD